MADTVDVTLGELNVGDVYLITSPKRVVKVIDHTMVMVRVKRVEAGGDVFVQENRKAVKFVATIAAFPIPGVISEWEAREGSTLRDALSETSGRSDVSDAVWEEIWTDRVVPGKDTAPGKVAKILDDKPQFNVLQVYCVETSRISKRERVSPIAMRPIGPIQFISASDVPIGLFMTDAELRDAEIRAGLEVPPEKLPRNFVLLQAITRSRGLDIEEVPKGENRVDRIIEFIRKAGQPKCQESSTESDSQNTNTESGSKPSGQAAPAQ